MGTPDLWYSADDRNIRGRVLFSVAAGVALIVMFSELLRDSLTRWLSEPQYSHGLAVPLLAVALLWLRRDRFETEKVGSHWAGPGLLVLGAVIHFAARSLYIEFLDVVAFLITACSLVLCIWGRAVFRIAAAPVLFLGFMLPLPFRVEHLLSAPLQQLGAEEAAFYIQACGIPAFADGNIIELGSVRLGVADACSGMRMLLAFVALAAAIVICTSRPAWQKVLILMSSVPIALICNVARIVATAVVYQTAGAEAADRVFHDVGGWLMMPVALILFFIVLRLMDWLFIERCQESPGVTVWSSQLPQATPRTS